MIPYSIGMENKHKVIVGRRNRSDDLDRVKDAKDDDSRERGVV